MKAGNLTIHIPTKPYLAKYLSQKYGNPVLLNNYSLMGVVVFSLLQKNVCTHYNLQAKHITFSTFTSSIKCIAPYRYLHSYGADLSDDQIIQLNRYFDAEFEETLYHHVDRRIKDSVRYKGYNDAIESFCKAYDITLEVDTTFECLKKCEYRFRKSINTLANSVPSKIGELPATFFTPENTLANSVLSKNPNNLPSLFDL